MTNEQKLTFLIKVLKDYAEQKHCYDGKGGGDYYYLPENSEDAFERGADYGEIAFARTLLEQIGENFEYPCMREEE